MLHLHYAKFVIVCNKNFYCKNHTRISTIFHEEAISSTAIHRHFDMILCYYFPIISYILWIRIWTVGHSFRVWEILKSSQREQNLYMPKGMREKDWERLSERALEEVKEEMNCYADATLRSFHICRRIESIKLKIFYFLIILSE